jgi:hypothetical protein
MVLAGMLAPGAILTDELSVFMLAFALSSLQWSDADAFLFSAPLAGNATHSFFAMRCYWPAATGW